MDTVHIWDRPMGSNTLEFDAYSTQWVTDHTQLQTMVSNFDKGLSGAQILEYARNLMQSGAHTLNVIHKWCPENCELHLGNLEIWSQLAGRAECFLCKFNQNQPPPSLSLSLWPNQCMRLVRGHLRIDCNVWLLAFPRFTYLRFPKIFSRFPKISFFADATFVKPTQSMHQAQMK